MSKRKNLAVKIKDTVAEYFSAGYNSGYKTAIEDMKKALEKLQDKK